MEKDKFVEWLTSGEKNPFEMGEEYGLCVNPHFIIRVEKNADFDYLFCQSKNISCKDFEFFGIYCKQDGRIYNQTQYFCILPKKITGKKAKMLLNELKNNVRRKVIDVIQNDRSNLQVTEVTDPCILNNIAYLPDRAKEDARNLYLEGSEPVVFHCNYNKAEFTEDELLAYILDPEEYARKEADNYIATKQEDMLYEFLKNDEVAKEYQALLADTDNQVHIIKKIMTAMAATPAKTVNVTVKKGHITFSFKTKAKQFRYDCDSCYDIWDVSSVDSLMSRQQTVRELERIFKERRGCYEPKDILYITYGKKTLYDART